MIIFFGILAIITLGLLFHSPSSALLFWTLLALSDYFQLVNFDVLFHLTLAKGISLNIGDLIAIFFFLYFFASKKAGFVSRSLVGLVLFLIVSVVVVFAFSAFFAVVDVGVVGNSLRGYMVYFTLLGMVVMINKQDKFDFVIKLVYCFALFAIFLHIYEVFRGSPVFIQGSGITHKQYILGAGSVGDVKRIWNRAMGLTVFVFAFSLASLITTRKRTFFHMVVAGLSLVSVILAYTRTLYIIVFIVVSVFLYSIFIKEKARSKSTFLSMIFITMFAFGAMAAGGGKYYDAFTSRVSTFAQGGQESITKNTVTDRFSQLNTFMDIVSENEMGLLTGVGFQSWAAELKTADLGFINLYIKIGVFGVAFMIWYFVYLRKGMIRYKIIIDPHHKRNQITLRCMIPAMLVSSVAFDYFMSTYFVVLAMCTILVERGASALQNEQQ